MIIIITLVKNIFDAREIIRGLIMYSAPTIKFKFCYGGDATYKALPKTIPAAIAILSERIWFFIGMVIL